MIAYSSICRRVMLFVFLLLLSPNLYTQNKESLADSVSSAANPFEQPRDTQVVNYQEAPHIMGDTLYYFKPDPNKAVWRAAIFPGLGQIYNRKYWKLPIVYGGFMALTYAIAWNGKYYRDYSIAYRDLMDTNPETNSFLNFLPPGSDSSSYPEEWLKSTFKRKNDYYRRNRDLSIIGMIGVYLISILDAYVDAQLYDFDISPDLSLHIEPAIIPTHLQRNNMVGLRCSFNF